jgi:hypothetical protein
MSEESKSIKPKLTSKVKKEIDSTLAKIKAIARHIKNVEDNCLLLGERLIQTGHISLGRQLIANGFVHDASKWAGIEFEYMSGVEPLDGESAKVKLKLAIQHHQLTNEHHVEYWSNNIDNMPDVFLAEMICDLKARSEEFGTSLMDYIDNVGIKKWNITKEHKKYKRIIEFVGLLCEKPFQEIK